jgi:NADH:ubiquinone oxidoreductase subunit 4 (subunit M)
MIRSPPPELPSIPVPCAPDPVSFHTFSESIPMPMMITIGVRGSRERKIGAAYQSSPHTSFGPVPPSSAILAIHPETGTTDVQISPTTQSNFHSQTSSRSASRASLAVKVPTIPVHT